MSKELVCPYCFKPFQDDAVHFRMETVYVDGVDDLDPIKGKLRELSEIENDTDYSVEERNQQVEQYKLNQKFLAHPDEKYENWWKVEHDFGESTEKSSISRDGKNPKVAPQNRPVYSPVTDGDMFTGSLITNDEGIVVKATDIKGKETKRRVCPNCHNPLPEGYGRFPVKFISIIGVTGAGKSVYISQFLNTAQFESLKVGVTLTARSDDAQQYVEDNTVETGKPLPLPTGQKQFLQPLTFEISCKKDGIDRIETYVLYDIAGENCVSVKEMTDFGDFIDHSNGIVLLISPEQFTSTKATEDPVKVVETIYLKKEASAKNKVKVPIAVCISKADQVVKEILEEDVLKNNEGIKNKQDEYVSVFNATDYNYIYDKVESYLKKPTVQKAILTDELKRFYDSYSYFLVSAIGGKPVRSENNEFDTPPLGAKPLRVFEPMAWLFYKHKFISATGDVHEPTDWLCKTCGKKHHLDEYCPVSLLNKDDQWHCSNCDNMNNEEVKYCPGKNEKKCGADIYGKKHRQIAGHWF